MAYNPNMYLPQYGYTNMAQPNWYYQPTTTQPANMQPINGLVSVTGIDGAKAYQLPPNSKMPLFDENDDVLYLKTTDSAGYPTVKTFRFEPMEQASAGYSQGDYVTRDEFDELVERISEIENRPRTTRSRKVSDAE